VERVEGGCLRIKAGENKDAKEKQRTRRKAIHSSKTQKALGAKVKGMGAKRLYLDAMVTSAASGGLG
jgi:hypothetical protein